jgi:hypothetical protein
VNKGRAGPVPGWPPDWLGPAVNIFIAVLMLGGYYALFGIGTWRALRGTGDSNWPTDNADLQTVLSGIGGLIATVFAVTLNLPTTETLGVRVARVLSVVRPPRDDDGNRVWRWESTEQRWLILLGLTLVISYAVLVPLGFIAALIRTDHTPGFIAKFSGPGMGIFVTALTLFLGKLTRE